MAYCRITRTANGADAIEYALGKNNKGHNGKKQRNAYVSCVNLFHGDKEDIIQQMRETWAHARSNHTTQLLRIVTSYSRNELDPDNPAHVLKAKEIAEQVAETNYKGRQVIICVQTDGKGGFIHTHMLVNDVDPVTYKACDNEQYWFSTVSKWFNDTIEKNGITLDYGEDKTKEDFEAERNNARDIVSRTERIKREQGKYVWKDDLKQRIASCMSSATSEAEFIEQLNAHGVNVDVHDPETRPKQKKPKYYTYELADVSNFPEGVKPPQNRKAKSTKLGIDYDVTTVLQTVERNKQQQLQQQAEQEHAFHAHNSTVEPVKAEKHIIEPVKDKTPVATPYGANNAININLYEEMDEDERALLLHEKARREEKARQQRTFFNNNANTELAKNKKRRTTVNGVDFDTAYNDMYKDHDRDYGE